MKGMMLTLLVVIIIAIAVITVLFIAFFGTGEGGFFSNIGNNLRHVFGL